MTKCGIIISCAEITIGFDPDSYTVMETDGTATVTVRILEGELAVGRTVDVDFRTVDGFGLSGA